MKKILLTTAVLAAFGFSAGASAQVTVTTGGGYVKMVEALADKYEAETGAKVSRAFGGNFGLLMSNFIDNAKLSKGDLEELYDMLRQAEDSL